MPKLFLLFLISALSSCSVTGSGKPVADGIAPIPGSITYGGQPRTKLSKSPVGTGFSHEFYNQTGNRVVERYVIQPDRSLKITSQEIINLPENDN
ncbi:hypothetical protein [Endobacterium cereale]|uniref:hypothetical protein n=1 Tax=Endobacterium cereale TaxID=2663029 RepID=UPI001F378215|nr:hypothetical protein [Endobacterium cereale]MEB2846493.1 hypothetical protein [Endobacterium cereale]